MFIVLQPAAAAAAKLLQSCPTLCDPRDGNPSGSTVPGILQARTLEWVAISFSNEWKWKVKVKSLSRVRPSATPWTAAYQAPLSMGFSGKSTGAAYIFLNLWIFENISFWRKNKDNYGTSQFCSFFPLSQQTQRLNFQLTYVIFCLYWVNSARSKTPIATK